MRRTLAHILSTAVLVLLYAMLISVALNHWQRTGRPHLPVLVATETLLIGLIVLRRRAREVSHDPRAWALAFVSTAAPLFLRPGHTLPVLGTTALVLQLVGTATLLIAVSSLGRSFGIVPANRGIQTGGLYRWVRHPLYGCYLVTYAGFLLGNLSTANILIVALWVACQHWRALAEESVLLRDTAYAAYYRRVRFRYLPGLV